MNVGEHVQVGRFLVRFIDEEEWATVEPWVRDAKLYPVWLPVRNPYTLVAERDGQVVGALSLLWGPWGYGIVTWVVRDLGNPRSRGAGAALAKAACLVLDIFGMCAVTALVSQHDTRILAWHRKIPGAHVGGEAYYTSWKRLGGTDEG